MNEERKIEFRDKRRIKSVDDTCDDAEEADLERVPTFVEELQGKMEEGDSRLKEYIAAHKEKMAEMDKVRKRLEEDAGRRASQKFGDMIKELFPVIDDLDRAIESAKDKSEDDPMYKGVVMLRSRIFSALEKLGMEKIDMSGKPFDPEFAQAVAAVVVEDEAMDNVVIEQLAPGFKYEDRVLRPAMVRVGSKP